MPWKGVTVDEERQRFLEDYKLNYYSISDLAERFSICRKTAHKWIDRFERHGLEGFHEVSRRPLSCPSRQDTPAQSAGTGPGRCGGRCQGALGLRLPLASSWSHGDAARCCADPLRGRYTELKAVRPPQKVRLRAWTSTGVTAMNALALLKLALFLLASVPIVRLSWPSLRNPRSHGFFRCFAFECLLALALLNIGVWFSAPWSPLQIMSWLLLLASAFLALHGFGLLRKIGRPNGSIEATTVLVTSGAYKYIRHPLYASLLSFGCGVFLKGPSACGPAIQGHLPFRFPSHRR